MTRIDEIMELYQFNAWAARRMFESTSGLPEDQLTRDLGSSFPSVRDTLAHIVGSEWVWLSRWQGTSPTALPAGAQALGHSQIARWWEEIETNRRAFLLALTPATLDRDINYTNFAGQPLAFPLWRQLRHVVNHSTYHRGQITTMLRQLGHPPVATDMIRMYQELLEKTV